MTDLTRRQLLQSFAATMAAIAVFAIPTFPRKRVGKVTAKTHMGKVRVFFNGIDVTKYSFEADDIEGYVGMFKLNDKGMMYFFRGVVAKERRYGNVIIEMVEHEANHG